MPPNPSQSLKACPFPGCGRQPIHGFHGDEDGGYGYVECPNQGGYDENSDGGHFCGVHADDEAAAIRIWNTRPLPDAGEDDLVERLRAFRPEATLIHQAANLISTLKARVSELEGALKFYANENNWRSMTVYMCGHGAINCNAMGDKGAKARAALGSDAGER